MGVSKSRMLRPKSRLQSNIFLNSLGVEIDRFQLKQNKVSTLAHLNTTGAGPGGLGHWIMYQNYSFNILNPTGPIIYNKLCSIDLL